MASGNPHTTRTSNSTIFIYIVLLIAGWISGVALDEVYSGRVDILNGNLIRSVYNAQCHGQLPIVVGDGKISYACKVIK